MAKPIKQEFENTKEVIRRRTDNTKGQKKKYKKANNDLQNIHIINKVITKLPNSEQSYKGKVKTHKYINRQNQSTTGKL